jgi:hypothetical protein
VLILTHPDDVHAHAVQAHLDGAGVDVFRVDTADLGGPAAPVIVAIGRDKHGRAGGPALGCIAGQVAGCDLSRVVGVWHRRPSELLPSGDPVERAELRSGVGGVLAALPYLNHPADMAVAALKPFQLVAAVHCGLMVPETVVSTVRGAAEDLAARLEVVVKPLSRQVGGLVTVAERAGWQRPMHLTQRRITPAWHARVTIVDGELFAVRIDSPHLDWRTDLTQCRYRVTGVPATVAEPLRALQRTLRLRYGAADFVVDRSGCWWFLEVNPNGQWLWIEQATGLPIAAAVAAALRRRSVQRGQP